MELTNSKIHSVVTIANLLVTSAIAFIRFGSGRRGPAQYRRDLRDVRLSLDFHHPLSSLCVPLHSTQHPCVGWSGNSLTGIETSNLLHQNRDDSGIARPSRIWWLAFVDVL